MNCEKRRSTENRCNTCRGLRRAYDKIPREPQCVRVRIRASSISRIWIHGRKNHGPSLIAAASYSRHDGSREYAGRGFVCSPTAKTEEQDEAKRDCSRIVGSGGCRRRRVRRRRQRSRGGRSGNPWPMSRRRGVRAKQSLSDRNDLLREPRASLRGQRQPASRNVVRNQPGLQR